MSAQTLGIIADDLTGSMDSSGYFAGRGLSTVVVLDPGFSARADVVVINTNSRAEDPDTAGEKVRRAAGSLKNRLVYKKIDSTLRGNIGVELAAAMSETACDKVVVAPAFPAVGRTMTGGILLVNGVAVAETQFAADPISPVKESHLPGLLEQTTGRQVGTVGVADIDAGAESLRRRINEMPADIVVCDVEKPSHLVGIVRAAALAEGRWLLCGSGGMARELYRLISPSGSNPLKPSGRPPGPALVVVGTRNPVAAHQLRKAQDALGFPILSLGREHLGRGDEGIARIAAEATRLLTEGKGVAISGTLAPYIPELKEVPEVMAAATRKILSLGKFGGLFLSGGDIAVAVCRCLSVAAISVLGEVEPGVPAGELLGGSFQGMRVVTKAGGFGTEEALVKSILYLEKGY